MLITPRKLAAARLFSASLQPAEVIAVREELGPDLDGDLEQLAHHVSWVIAKI